MAELLKGRVAKFLSRSKIVINLGMEHGVKEGMDFIIYDEGPLIIDPETGLVLENLEIIKGRVKITNVQQKISIGESFKFISTPTPYNFLQTMQLSVSRKVEIVLTDKDIEEQEPGPIRIRDLVRQVKSNSN